MGRRPKNEEDKRRLIGARFDRDARAFIHEQAEANGRSPGAEVEARVVATEGLDTNGLDLIRAISREITEIQRATGKRWHKDLKTWAAVKEMLYRGPIHAARPDNWEDDEWVVRASAEPDQLTHRRHEIINFFSSIGIMISESPLPMGTGLLASTLNLDGGRTHAREVLNDAEPGPERDEALAKLDALLVLDREIEAAKERWLEQVKPYLEAESEGAILYREALQRNARQRAINGEKYRKADFLGVWS